MTKLAKQAAQNRIKQLRKSISEQVFYKDVLVNRSEALLDESLREVSQLVTDHELDRSLIDDFRSSALAEMYARAGEYKLFAWQATLARKHGL